MARTHTNEPHMLVWYQQRRDNRGNVRWFRHVEGYARAARARETMLDRWATGVPARIEYLTRWSDDPARVGRRLTEEWRLVEAIGDEGAEDAWSDSRNEAAERRRARSRKRVSR